VSDFEMQKTFFLHPPDVKRLISGEVSVRHLTRSPSPARAGSRRRRLYSRTTRARAAHFNAKGSFSLPLLPGRFFPKRRSR